MKLEQECKSKWGYNPAGVPQKTKVGPCLFLSMTDDVDTSNTSEMWKYVDDTTIAEHVSKNQVTTIQHPVNQLHVLVKSDESK